VTSYEIPFADFDAHIRTKTVSFREISVSYLSILDENINEHLRRRFAQYYQQLRESFEKAHDGIRGIYWGPPGSGFASVLTGDDEVYDIAPSPEAKNLKLYQLMWDCEELVIETRNILKGPSRKVTMQRLWEIISNIMAAISAPQAKATPAGPQAKAALSRATPSAVAAVSGGSPPGGSASSSDEIVEFWAEQVKEVRNYYVHSAERNGLENYLLGTALGVGATAIVAGLVFLLAKFSPSNVWVDALAAFISGAAGGAVSVMSRMIHEELTVHYNAGERLIRLGGFFRPIVGGVLGSILFAAVISGLIPLTIPTDYEKALACYSVVAFVGGLAERWAQDTLVQSVGASNDKKGKGETDKKGKT